VFNDPKALTPKRHIFGELTQTREISAVRATPSRKCAIVFTLVIGEGRVHFVEAAQRKLNGFYDRKWTARTVQHHHPLPDLGQLTSSRGPARRALSSVKNE
jgi:hypothetical protein